MSTREEEPRLVKMSHLARMSGVPAPTIKHYIREGLLPPPARRTGRNMAWYDPALVERIKAIKELQRTRFLPLKVIRKLLDEGRERPEDEATAAAIQTVLGRLAPETRMSRDEIIAAGSDPADVEWFESQGLITAQLQDGQAFYGGDDLTLIRLLADARRRGLTAEMLPTSILTEYMKRVRKLTKMELRMFREGVLPRAGDDIEQLAEAAIRVSEQLIIQLRRRALLPALDELVAGERGE